MLKEPDQTLLEKLHLTEGDYLTHAAALMFHPEPEHLFTGAYVKIGYFENNVDLRYQDEVAGDLVAQVNQTIEVLKAKYLRAWITYEGLQRIESFPVPEEALREAVLNAVVHKDYTTAIPIQISVYPDKLMIWNPGELPADWTVEKLLGKHASIPFNPDVANVFFRTGMIESWGRGIERIMEACHEAGTPEPEVKFEATGLWVSFQFLPEHQVVADAIPPIDNTSVTPPVTPPVGEYVMRLLKLLSLKGAQSNADIRKVFQLKDRRRLRETYIAPAMADGLIEHTIPDKPNSRLQQYRLTAKGISLLAEMKKGNAT